ncbi:MAG: NADH-quinone oxidoreductase subunit M [Cytophagales bacterium]|nr:NADH-quinone oxidoreductase subunit M [Cytophagales bacterium]
MLSVLLLLPLFFCFILLCLSKRYQYLYRLVTLASTLGALFLSIYLAYLFNYQTEAYQFFYKADWISLALGSFGKLSIDYCVGIDGISLSLLLLTSFICFIAVWNSEGVITEKHKAYYSLILLLQSALIGCFISLDLFLFYLFFELILLPMYFLIGIWGGPRKEYASIKFFLYTLLGSIFILLAIIALYISGFDPQESASLRASDIVHTFRIDILQVPGHILQNTMLAENYPYTIFGLTYRECTFLLLFVGFIIKLPSVPLHTWLPDAHVEAPTPVSVLLAAILLKVGAYGLIRIAMPIFPAEALHFSWLISGLGVASILWGAYNALAQNDLKKMIAYSSVSHMGYVLLGLAAFNIEGLVGAVYQMVSHGLLSAALFLIAGVLYHRTHTRNIDAFGGLAHAMPMYAAVVTITFFASLGLPCFSAFVAEIMIFLGAFSSYYIPKWLTIMAIFGLILTAGYFLWTLQRMFLGKYYVHNLKDKIADLKYEEVISFAFLLFLVIILGVFPQLLINYLQPACKTIVEMYHIAIY